MATVTGITAEHMLELNAQDVVDGEVSGDHLILTQRSGATIDAGNVRGPQGDHTTEDVNATASTVPIRTSVGGRLKGGTATAVDDLTTKAQMDTADASVASTAASATLLKLDKTVYTGVELTATDDLNNFKTAGVWFQSNDSEATLALHYPIATQGGILEVFKSATKAIQRYTSHVNSGSVIWNRNWNGTAWEAWYTYSAQEVVTPWINVTTGFKASVQVLSAAGYPPNFRYRIINGRVELHGAVQTTIARTGNFVLLTLPAACFPLYTSHMVINANSVWTGYGITPAGMYMPGMCLIGTASGDLTINFGTSASLAANGYYYFDTSYPLF